MDPLAARAVDAAQYPIKQRNAFIDSLFYDVGALTSDEQVRVSPLVDREGAIIVVSPGGSPREMRHYKNALRFMNNEGHDIRAIVVAGVGSSALGTAALARNVADAYGVDVAGIVTGYGFADLLAEGVGGWFFYGVADRFRRGAELALENMVSPLRESRSRESASRERALAFGVDSRFTVAGNTDAGTLLDILIANPRRLRLLVGHSKGSLLISFVLWHLVDELGHEPTPYYEHLTVATLGAVVTVPPHFRRRYLVHRSPRLVRGTELPTRGAPHQGSGRLASSQFSAPVPPVCRPRSRPRATRGRLRVIVGA